MAIHSSILAWRISWAEEPNGLQSSSLQKNRLWLSYWTGTIISLMMWPDRIYMFSVLRQKYIFFTLKYWICFATHQYESAMYTCSPCWTPLPLPSPDHLSELCQCTSPKYPVSCIEPGLAIHFMYDITQVSTPFSQIIPPSPSLTESKRLFYTSVSLFSVSHTGLSPSF